MVGVSHLLRVALPDVPGSLGTVATTMGLAGANIEAIEIVEHRRDGSAVDDVFFTLSPNVMPDMVVSALQQLDDVEVLWVSRYAAGGSLHMDLEAVEMLTEQPARASLRLAEVVPGTFRSDWALVIERDGAGVAVLVAAGGAPDLPAACGEWFPLRSAARPEVSGWPGWASTVVAAAPLGTPDRALVFGRRGGPDVLDSELARLNHLAALAVSIEAAATA